MPDILSLHPLDALRLTAYANPDTFRCLKEVSLRKSITLIQILRYSMKRISFIILSLSALLILSACGEEAKIKSVQSTVIPNCNGKTMQDLTASLLEKPIWAYTKQNDGKQFVTVNGTIAGDKLPDWVRDKKLMDVSFRFALDAKTDKYNPAELDGFPSLTSLSSPEGILQAYKTLICR